MLYKLKTIIATLLFGFSSLYSIAQSTEEWQPAYVVMRTSCDTIYGTMSTPKIKTIGDWVNFYTTNKSDIKKYNSDSITAFKYKDTECKYFKYSGWSTLLHKGKIDVYMGNVYIYISNPYGGGYKRMDCLVFKKGNEKAKFIGYDEVKLLSGGELKRKTKEYFSEYIADNPELLKEFNNENFKFKELENLIVRYNQLSKNK